MKPRCPLCNAEIGPETGQNGRPRTYCSDEHRKEAEAERARLRALLNHLGRRRVAAVEAYAVRPQHHRQAVIDALDAEIVTTRNELVRLCTAAGTTPDIEVSP